MNKALLCLLALALALLIYVGYLTGHHAQSPQNSPYPPDAEQTPYGYRSR